VHRYRSANRRGILRVGGAVFLGALQFFLVTNFASGNSLAPTRNPHRTRRLLHCGLPFFGNAIAGDALYATLFFGTFALAEKFFPTFVCNRSTRLLIKSGAPLKLVILRASDEDARRTST